VRGSRPLPPGSSHSGRHIHKWERVLEPRSLTHPYDLYTHKRRCTDCRLTQCTSAHIDLPSSLIAYADVEWS
jgi:hypothetical protein